MIDTGLLVFLIAAVVLVVGYMVVAQRRGWLHWELCTAAMLTDCWLFSRRTTLILRAVFACYLISVYIDQYYIYGGQMMQYYTLWGYTLLTFTHVVSWRRRRCFAPTH